MAIAQTSLAAYNLTKKARERNKDILRKHCQMLQVKHGDFTDKEVQVAMQHAGIFWELHTISARRHDLLQDNIMAFSQTRHSRLPMGLSSKRHQAWRLTL